MARTSIRTTLAGAAGARPLALTLAPDRGRAAPPAGRGRDHRTPPRRPGRRPTSTSLFVGAHPDDEACDPVDVRAVGRATHDVRTGVITITRGEGGGNAVGPEEGPALGLIREARGARARSRKAGITDVYNLDEVDFFYTVSDAADRSRSGATRTTLGKVGADRPRRPGPRSLVDDGPGPSPGNHGNHQEAAPHRPRGVPRGRRPHAGSPSSSAEEGLQHLRAPTGSCWAARRGTEPAPARLRARGSPRPTRRQTVYGVWAGATSRPAVDSWAAVERDAQREYASQGWAGFPDVPTDPNALGCDFFTQVDVAGAVAAAGHRGGVHRARRPATGRS